MAPFIMEPVGLQQPSPHQNLTETRHPKREEQSTFQFRVQRQSFDKSTRLTTVHTKAGFSTHKIRQTGILRTRILAATLLTREVRSLLYHVTFPRLQLKIQR